jgi:hypothetical protein
MGIEELDRLTREWTYAAARGETSWICSDCGASFPDGMPDECAYGHESCTRILKRDKEKAGASS